MIKNLLAHLKKCAHHTQGAVALEYGLIAALIAVVIIGATSSLGTSIKNKLFCIAYKMSTQALCAGETISTGFDNVKLNNSWDVFTNGTEVVDGWKSSGVGEVEVGQAYLYGLPTSPSGATKVLELNGHSAGTLSKTLQTIPGQEYTVTFDQGNRTGAAPIKEFAVSIGGVTTDYRTPETHTWRTETITFTATSTSTNIEFIGKNLPGENNGYGAVIAGISVAAK